MVRPTTPAARLFRFGLFEADLTNALLTRKGVRIPLQEQPFRILSILLERAGQTVTREELRQELWPTGTFVDFDGSLNAALKRLRAALGDDADNPRFIETIPKHGYRFIAPVALGGLHAGPLIEEPRSPALPDTNHGPSQTPELPEERTHWTRQRFAAVAAIFLLAGLSSTVVLMRSRSAVRTKPLGSPATSEISRRSIAILGFHNSSGRSDEAWLSTALTEMLRTELGTGNRVRVVPGENIAQFRLSTPWQETDSLSPETAARIGQVLDGDLLLLGSYVTVGEPQEGAIRIDFRLQQAQTGEILYEGAETGRVKQLFGLVAKVGVALRQRLGLPLSTESEEVGVISSLPSDPDANRFYSLGLEKWRDADVATAKDLFLQAEKIAPRSPMVRLMLFRTWGALGYDQRARAEIKKAFGLSASLPETEKLQVEGAYFQSLKDLDRAAAKYRALFALYPDSMDYAEQLITVSNAAGRREEALAIINRLRQLPPPASDDPRIDFWQAKLVSYTNGPAAGPLIDKAVAGAAARGQKLLYARFRLEQCLGSIYAEQAQSAIARCQEAYDIFMATGNRLYAADALRIIGDRRGSEGDFDAAHEMYQRALAILRQLGEHERIGAVMNNMAVAAENQGQLNEAEKLFREARRNFEECGDTFNIGVTMGNIGDVLLERGELRKAEKQYREARRLLQHSNPMGVEYDLYNIAEVRLLQGGLVAARHYAAQAFEMAQARGSWEELSQAATGLGDIALAEGDLVNARRRYERALAIGQKAGARRSIAQSQAALADVSIEEGKLDEAETALRQSLAEFQAEHATMSEVLAETDLSRVLLKQGKLVEAREAISNAIALSRTSRDPNLKLPVAIQDAGIEAAELVSSKRSTPDLSSPRRKLENVISTARKLGYYGHECDARLTLGEIGLRTAPSAARSQLTALAEQTRDHGLNLVSAKAARLLRSPASSPSLTYVP